MHISPITPILTLTAFLAVPACAQSGADDAAAPAATPSVAISGSVAHRFRGVSQTDENMVVVQRRVMIAHDRGFHVGAWGTFGGADKSDFAEPHVKFTGTAGPATRTAGAACVPKQQALGRWYRDGADAAPSAYHDPGDKEDGLKGQDGTGSIASAAVVVSPSAAF